MKRSLLALAAAVLLPTAAQARSLAREGTVAILPSARLHRAPSGLEGSAVAPGAGLAFGFKPSESLEVGIDLSASYTQLEGKGGTWDVVAAPIFLRLSWTPTPRLDLRPVLHAGLGKAFLSVDGPAYREHTPTALEAALGFQADLSKRVGVMADAGYLYLQAEDPTLGTVDGGGFVARAGVYFRWEPIPERRF